MTLFVALVVLVLPGVLPAVALSGRGAQVPFLAPLVGAVLAALAATSELLVGSSLSFWYVAWVIDANVLAGGLLLTREMRRRRRAHEGHSWRRRALDRRLLWQGAVFLVVAGALSWPVTAASTGFVGYDAQAIWIMHAVFLYGGHGTLLRDLRNPVYAFSNPDYPPLVPAASTLGFFIAGRVDYPLAIALTTALNASGLGLAACGVAKMAERAQRSGAKVAALVGAGALCLAGFGIGGQFGQDGYADVLWAAAATAAVIYGLVLPVCRQNLMVAWVSATVAALTKNEGLVAGVIILSLVAVRFTAVSGVRWPGSHVPRTGNVVVRRFFEWKWPQGLALAVLLVIPGVTWAAGAALEGLENGFFSAKTSQSLASRFTATVPALATYLHIALLAVPVLVVGIVVLRTSRRGLGLGNPAWLWAVLVAWLATLVYTYTFGDLSIGWWLYTSANRTTIFPQVLLCAEVTIWAIVACERRRSTPPVHSAAGVTTGGQRLGTVVLPSRERAGALPSP